MMTACVMRMRLRGNSPLRRATSFIEVLVVIGIFAFMLAMLLPSLNYARELARRVVCRKNQAQWGIAAQCYRDDFDDYLPTEGTHADIDKPGTWFLVLPPYLNVPPYTEIERMGKQIREFPEMHVWICPSKYVTDYRKSDTGMNQFHYGMNQVLDGLGQKPHGSKDTPGFWDQGDDPLDAARLAKNPHTVLMFDIFPNSPAGTQRDVASMYQRDRVTGEYVGRFHGDYANILYLDGRVGNCVADDLVADRDFRHGRLVWDHPRLYWGWMPPPK